MPTVLDHLLASARADLACARRWHAQTQDPTWARLAAAAAEQVEAFESAISKEFAHAR